MGTRYAENTLVSAERSRNEIEATLTRYGANGFAYGWQGSSATIVFEMHKRRIRFVVQMPDKKEFSGIRDRGFVSSQDRQKKAYEQSVRQKWRSLSLAVKAKLEAVASGITHFEDEFMAHIVLPNGDTVGDWMKPQIENAYGMKKMPPMLTA